MRLRYFHGRSWTVAVVLVAVVGCGTTPALPPASIVSSPAPTASTLVDATIGSTPDSVSVTLLPRTMPGSDRSDTTRTDPPTSADWIDVTGNLVGIDSECGNVSIVASSPSSATEVAVIALHGAFSMDDGSGEWVPLGAGASSAKITNRGMTIVFDPTHSDTFWEVGSYNGGGIYRTDDAGQTFQQLGTLTHIDGLAIDFEDPLRQTMIAVTHESSTIYRSADGGVTWADISQDLPASVGYLSGPLLMGPNEYLVGSRMDTDSGIFVTTNGGATWRNVYQGGVSGYPVVPADDGIMYWAQYNGGMIASTDGGANWTAIADAAVTSAVPINVVALADGRIATVGSKNGILASSDRGHTWSYVSPKLPFSANGLSYSATENAFYAWRFDCNSPGKNVITEQSIVRFDLDGN